MKENINELLEEINDQELEGEVVGGMLAEGTMRYYTGVKYLVCQAPY